MLPTVFKHLITSFHSSKSKCSLKWDGDIEPRLWNVYSNINYVMRQLKFMTSVETADEMYVAGGAI